MSAAHQIRVLLPPFGPLDADVEYSPAVFEIPLELGDGASYALRFKATHKDADTGRFVYVLNVITCDMPPLTPEASGYGDDVRLRMPTVAEEREQRQREWAARGKVY